ncbi:hypothetical protein PR048_012542 [Dryococelus australis]|uniref:Uncharacterized protein n=1 Tax=Dryococelus australis TaxID=614101 RepID=A0ABQ9HPU5_9NEOP|nr:hypothetical protein PR048_012542 [Dryococelus australis]
MHQTRFRVTLGNICRYNLLFYTADRKECQKILKETGRIIKYDYSRIQVLVGADVAGKLLTEEKRVLKNWLVAVNTYLGWTLMGTVQDFKLFSKNMIVSMLFYSQKPTTALWELDVLGIGDPELQSEKKIGAFLCIIGCERSGSCLIKIMETCCRYTKSSRSSTSWLFCRCVVSVEMVGETRVVLEGICGKMTNIDENAGISINIHRQEQIEPLKQQPEAKDPTHAQDSMATAVQTSLASEKYDDATATIPGLMARTQYFQESIISGDIWAALNIEVLREDEGAARSVSSNAGTQERGNRGVPEETRRPVISSSTIPTSESPGVTPPGIEPRSPNWRYLESTTLSTVETYVCVRLERRGRQRGVATRRLSVEDDEWPCRGDRRGLHLPTQQASSSLQEKHKLGPRICRLRSWLCRPCTKTTYNCGRDRQREGISIVWLARLRVGQVAPRYKYSVVGKTADCGRDRQREGISIVWLARLRVGQVAPRYKYSVVGKTAGGTVWLAILRAGQCLATRLHPPQNEVPQHAVGTRHHEQLSAIRRIMRAAGAELLAPPPPLRQTGSNLQLRHSRISASTNRAGRCRLLVSFLGDLPFPSQLHSGTTLSASQFTLIGSHEIFQLNPKDMKFRGIISGQDRFQKIIAFRATIKLRLHTLILKIVVSPEWQGTASACTRQLYSPGLCCTSSLCLALLDDV